MLPQEEGLTIIELMIVITLVGVLMAIAVPNFRDFVRRNQLTTQANEFVAAINLARAEAIRRNRSVSLIATDASDADNEWGSGWRVTIGVEPPLRVAPALPGSLTLDSSNGSSAIVFTAAGLLQAGSDVFLLCDPEKSGHRIEITASGQTSHQQKDCP